MPDNKETRSKVTKANEKLRKAKDLQKKTGKEVPLQLRTELSKAVQEYEAKK